MRACKLGKAIGYKLIIALLANMAKDHLVEVARLTFLLFDLLFEVEGVAL